jgi:hypothetical protein
MKRKDKSVREDKVEARLEGYRLSTGKRLGQATRADIETEIEFLRKSYERHKEAARELGRELKEWDEIIQDLVEESKECE